MVTPPPNDPDYQPTSAMPGSDEKMAVMALRASRHFPLHHPGDFSFLDAKIDELLGMLK
jgi:hypothetical protein